MAPADDADPSEDALPEDETSSEEGSEEEKPKKKLDKKKLIIFAVTGLLGLIIIGGGLAYFMGWLNPLLGIEEEHKVAEVQLGAPVTFDLPQIKADLRTAACRSPFLRVKISVQLSEHDLGRLEEAQDKVMDQIITHLRDQERQDLVGKAGSDRLRFDLVSIINNVINPSRIHGIIFKEFVLQ